MTAFLVFPYTRFDTLTAAPDDGELPPKLNWKKPSKAVVAQGLGGGCVLYTAGPHVSSMVDDAGVSDLGSLGLDDAPEGISVWVGVIQTVHHHTPDCNEYDSWLEGAFREPTDEEWACIRQGKCPWDEQDWVVECTPLDTTAGSR